MNVYDKNIIQNLKKYLTFKDKIVLFICKRFSIKIYRRGLTDGFNQKNKCIKIALKLKKQKNNYRKKL